MRTVQKADLTRRLRTWITASRNRLVVMSVTAALEIADALEEPKEPNAPKLKEPMTRAIEFVRSASMALRSWGCRNCGLNFHVDGAIPVAPTCCPYCRMKFGEFVPSLIHEEPKP